MEINKELIKNVLNCEIEDFKMLGCDLMYYEKALFRANCQGRVSKNRDSICKSINIYEFAFKCKEWAFKKNYTIVDGIDGIGEDICYIMKINGYSLESYYEQGVNYHNVFKACNWILEQQK